MYFVIYKLYTIEYVAFMSKTKLNWHALFSVCFNSYKL